ncbi:lysozyme-like [Penaeus chinensis]|uniref:lysozyme-like n=1 Tax=Penaeus chinensis TaxID=139456 RepID=UPI001FB5AE7D|nr:lysozyme-like [Penaeus chinensis]
MTMARPLPILLLLGLAVTLCQANLTDECLWCMCYVSSNGCKMPEPVCQNNGWGEVCGPWAMSKPYWMDGGNQNGDFYACAEDWSCNESTVRSYLARYVTSPYATCQYYARTHVGGPNGASQEYTLDYWYQVKDCLDYGIYTPPPTTD